MNDDFCDHGVIVRFNGQTGCYAAVEPDSGAARLMEKRDLPRRRHEMVVRIFGIDAAFYGVSGKSDVVLCDFQGFSCCNADLCADEIKAGHCFSDSMLYLNARIDFHKIEFIIGKIQQKFHRTDIGVMDALGCFDGETSDAVTHVLRQSDGRRFFQQFLIAPLQRAFAFAEVQDFAIVVRDDLHFDMAGVFDVMFKVIFGFGDVDEVIENVAKVFFVMCDAHAFAAASGYWFEDNRITYFAGCCDGFFPVGEGIASFCHRNTGRRNGRPGDVFITDEPDGFRHRSDPGQTGF